MILVAFVAGDLGFGCEEMYKSTLAKIRFDFILLIGLTIVNQNMIF